jgi:AraC-like DNA-binding protein
VSGSHFPDPLELALQRLRLEGAIFLRAEYTESWEYESLGPEVAEVLHPGARRVILFHIVAAGRCWIACPPGERHWADAGDVIVLPYGNQHHMGGTEDAQPVSIASFLPPMPWAEFPVLRHGGGGSETKVVCGYLHCADPLFDPALGVFPPVFVARPPEGPAARWVEASVAYAIEASRSSGTPTPTATRLPELMLVEMLRLHLATAPATARGLVAALRDPALAPALALLHGEPERKWTVEELASRAAVSRSVLDERFRRFLGRSPIRYLAEWRMHVAADLLATTELGVAAVAHRVGYDAEEAFSRAFKRHHGRSPAFWREQHGPAIAVGGAGRRGAGQAAP